MYGVTYFNDIIEKEYGVFTGEKNKIVKNYREMLVELQKETQRRLDLLEQ